MFRAIITPILRSTRLCLPSSVTSRQHRGCIIPQAVNSLVLLRTGEIITRNMLS